MSETALVPTSNLQETLQLGQVLAESGFFKDTREASQAVVKVLAGQELGIGPIAAMGAIHIVQGKPTLSANIIAAKVKGSGKYDYRVIENTGDACELAFFQGGEEIGRSRFTMTDAMKAKLSDKDVWKKYPRNMLFSRAMSNGARWFCPDAFSGITVYTPEELGAEVDHEGDIIDVTPTKGPDWDTVPQQTQPPPEPPAATTNGRPLTADRIRDTVRKKANWQNGTRLVDGEPITEKQVGFVAGLMAQTMPDNYDKYLQDKARHLILNYLWTVDSTNNLTKAEASATIDWLAEPGTNEVNEYATAEVAGILKAIGAEAGQQEMVL